MASPESVKMGSEIAPDEPAEALDADTAESGEVSTVKAEAMEKKKKKASGKEDPKKTSWIELVLVDMNGKGIAGESWEIEAPDGQLFSGTTDQNGKARLEGIDPGSCQITFPRLDKEAWEPA